MAQKVTVALVDDLDGGPADETVRFGFEGSDYEIDLSRKRQRLPPAARAVHRARPQARAGTGPPGRTAASRQRGGDIRAWAREHGIAVSEGGRIPTTVLEQYQSAGKPR